MPSLRTIYWQGLSCSEGMPSTLIITTVEVFE